MKFLPDEYTVVARILPCFLVALPGALTLMAWSADAGIAVGWSGLWGMVGAAGGTKLVAELGRDRGKRLEKHLWDSWGGRPTERLLCFAQCPHREAVERRHAHLRRLFPDLRVPTEEEERADPFRANQDYELCVDALRAKVRDSEIARLVFEENKNYGFRRNLWGLKPYGLIVSGVGALILVGLFTGLAVLHERIAPALAVCASANLMAVLIWATRITSTWVRTPADAYAARLMECLEKW